MKEKNTYNIFADLRDESKKPNGLSSLSIYPSSHWLLKKTQMQAPAPVQKTKSAATVTTEKAPEENNKMPNSEKEQILKSMEKFVVEQGPNHQFEGGQAVALASANQYFLEFKNPAPKSISEIGDIPMCMNQNPNKKVAFVGEQPKDWDTDRPGTDILSKMIKAMGLGLDDVALFFIPKEDEQNSQELLHRELVLLDIKWVISLGARAASMLVGKRERLNQIHGKLLEVEANHAGQKFQFEVLPIFHPDYLQINPSMKKTAWEDLQVIMKRIS